MTQHRPCGVCGMPLHPSEAVRHFGLYIAHQEARCVELLRARIAELEPNGMGVTGNAVLLLGYIAGLIARDGSYEFVNARPSDGTQTIRRAGTKNLYRLAIIQIEGIE